MEPINWQGSKNPLRVPMLESVANAIGILTFTRNALFANIGNPDPGFLQIFKETDFLYQQVLVIYGAKGSAETAKTANTASVELLFTGMKTNLDAFDDAVRPVFGKGSLEYESVWGKTRDRFYQGSYEERISALLGLATAMHDYPALASAEGLVNDYYKSVLLGRETQQGLISSFKTDGVSGTTLIEACIKQMDRNLGWLKFFFALQTDAQAQVNNFFDLSKIITHASKEYPVNVSKASWAVACIHTFKSTDMLEITVDGPEDVLICLKEDGKVPCGTTAYRGISGTKVKVLATVIFPDLTSGRQVIGTNTSMVQATHFIITIIEA